MLTQSDKDRCTAVRAKLSRHQHKMRKSQQESEFKEQKMRLNQLSTLITEVFYSLDKAVQRSCGVPDQFELYSCHSFLIREPEYAQIFQEKTGLSIKHSLSKEEYVVITLSSDAKLCRIDGAELDFASLITENQRRREAWQEFIDPFSRKIIDICVKCLSQIPDLCFGIPDQVTVTQNGQTAFAKSFKFFNLTIEYGALWPEQAAELEQHINQQISHGDVSIKVNHNLSQGVMWVGFLRSPEKVVDGAYFDYQSLYWQYDIETPELRSAFKAIADQLQLVGDTEQFINLTPQYKLIYPIKDDAEYDLLTQRLLNHPHERDLRIFLEDEFNISITGIKPSRVEEHSYSRCRTRLTYSNRKLEINYKTDVTATSIPFLIATTQHPLVRQQLELDRQIEELKQDYEKFAEILICRFLGIAEQHIKSKTLRQLPQKNTSLSLNGELSTVEVAGHTVNLLEVADEDFLANIQHCVAAESDQLIQIDFKDKSYYFS